MFRPCSVPVGLAPRGVGPDPVDSDGCAGVAGFLVEAPARSGDETVNGRDYSGGNVPGLDDLQSVAAVLVSLETHFAYVRHLRPRLPVGEEEDERLHTHRSPVDHVDRVACLAQLVQGERPALALAPERVEMHGQSDAEDQNEETDCEGRVH